MRASQWFGLLLGIWCGTLGRAWAEDTPAALIDKAIKAQGGLDQLRKFKAMQATQKGIMDLSGLTVHGTAEMYLQVGDQFQNCQYKLVLKMTANGRNLTTVQIMNKGKMTVTVDGRAIPLSDAMREEGRQQGHAEFVSNLLPLQDKNYKLALLPEIKVRDHPAIGIKVSAEGFRDVSLYFDKENGLLVKRAYRTKDPMTSQESLQETYYADYKDFDGLKLPVKARAERDGKRFLEIEVTAVRRVEKLDDKVFEP